LTILGAGYGGKIDLDDLGLKKNYTLANAGSAAQTYNDIMIEDFASREPGIAFTHIAPGVVRTPLLKLNHWALRPLGPILALLLRPISVSPEDCAEYMMSAMLQGDSGAFRRKQRGEIIEGTSPYVTAEAKQKLRDHTMEATNGGTM